MEDHRGWYPEFATRLKRGSVYSTYSIVAGAATKSTEIPNALYIHQVYHSGTDPMHSHANTVHDLSLFTNT
jgi:hypothetical protein